MPTGKPNFNLNSYGIKYLSKDEVQEFLEKRTQGESIRSQGETRTRPLGTSGKPMDSGSRQAGQHRGSTSGLKRGEFTPSLAGRNQIDATINTPKPEAEKPATATSSTISAPNAAGNKKLQGGTRSQFMSREDTTPKSNYAKQIAGDIKEARGKVDESGIVSRGGEQSVSGEGKGKRVPSSRIKPLHGKNPDGSKTDDSKATPPQKPKEQALGTIIGSKNEDNKKEEKESSKEKKTQTGGARKQTGLKNLPLPVGDAPKGTKSEKELIGGRNTQVGVGSKAHKKLEKNPQGELTESQKPKEDKPDKRVKDLNDQNPRSVKGRAHTTRTRENMKWYNDDQKAAYDKIDPKDRTAQSKFHDEQDKEYDKSVSTPKKLSAAGQSIKDKLSKKSNDIITEMNILKLDLMKDGAMMTQHRQGNMKRRVGQRGGRSDYQHEQRSGSLARNEPQTREGQADDSTQPRVQLGHSAYTPTHEVENPWVKEPRSAGENTSIYEYNLDQHKPDKLHGTIPKGGKAPDNVGDNKPQKSKEIKAGEPEEPQLAGGVIPKGGNSPKGMKVKKSAEETIFKAISLKLDLSKDL